MIETKESPLLLKKPLLTTEYTMHVNLKDCNEILVCTVGKTILHYNIDRINHLQTMHREHSELMELGSADEQKPSKEDIAEGWERSENNPVSEWNGPEKGFRKRFGMFVPPLMEALGYA